MTKEEMMLKAEAAKNIEELMALAKENGLELSEEDAKKYLEMKKSGELSDDSLADVSGGAGYTVIDGYLIVTRYHSCHRWHCEKCGFDACITMNGVSVHSCPDSPLDYGTGISCLNCKYQEYRFPYNICTHPNTRKT